MSSTGGTHAEKRKWGTCRNKAQRKRLCKELSPLLGTPLRRSGESELCRVGVRCLFLGSLGGKTPLSSMSCAVKTPLSSMSCAVKTPLSSIPCVPWGVWLFVLLGSFMGVSEHNDSARSRSHAARSTRETHHPKAFPDSPLFGFLHKGCANTTIQLDAEVMPRAPHGRRITRRLSRTPLSLGSFIRGVRTQRFS